MPLVQQSAIVAWDIAITLGAPVTAGSTLIAVFAFRDDFSVSLSDTHANTWVQPLGRYHDPGYGGAAIFHVVSDAGGSITITPAGSSGPGYWRVLEVSGLDAAALVNASAEGSVLDNSSPFAPTLALDTTAECFLIVAACDSLNNSETCTGAAGDITSFVSLASGYSFGYADSVASGSRTAGLVFGSPDTWAMQAFAFKKDPTWPPQFLRPSSDVSAGTWSASYGTIASCLDETPASDTDYASATGHGTFRVNLSPGSTPAVGTRTLMFRAKGSPDKKLIVTLIEGSSTAIAASIIDPLPVVETNYSLVVTNTVTDYGDLDLSFEVSAATTPPTPSVTFGALGTAANGGTTVAPTYPSGITAGMLLVLTVTSGSSTNPTPSTPSEWTLQGTYATTNGTYGIDTGPRRVTVFTKVAVGTETGTLTVTITGGDSCRGSIMRIIKSQSSYTWDIAATGGDYSAAGTAVSVAGGAIGFAPGDLVLVSGNQRVDTVTHTAQALVASGITFDALTNVANVAVTTGSDHRHIIYSRPVSAGTASVAPTFSYTASAACSAAVHFLRLREVPPTEFARATWTEFRIPVAAGGSGSVFADSDIRWSMLAPVQEDGDIRWSTLKSAQSDTDARWSMLSAAQSDGDIRWSMLAPAQGDSDLRWSMLISAQADSDLRWSMLKSAQSDLDARWALLASAQSDADLRWEILSAVLTAQADLDARWGMLVSAQGDADARWEMLSAAQSDIDARWGILTSAIADADAQWAMLASAQADTDLRWQILSALLTAQADLDARWSMLISAQSDSDLRWAMIAAVQADADARWALLVSALANIDARWSMLASAQNDADIRWQMGGSAATNIDLRWSVGALAVLASRLRPKPEQSAREVQTTPSRRRVIQTATRYH